MIKDCISLTFGVSPQYKTVFTAFRIIKVAIGFTNADMYGVKGIGEPVMNPTAPAITNAIYNAVGVRITDLPITPEKIVNSLKSKK